MTDEIDPKRWMQGFPPAPDVWVRFDRPGAAQFPQLRWAVNHYREMVPTKTVCRAAEPVPLPRAVSQARLDDIAFTAMTGEATTWADAFAAIHTDGLCVLHRGRIVYERYWGGCEAHRPHIVFSVTKSFVGLLAQMLVHEGALDESARVPHYLPEMSGTAYDTATIRDVMDMRIGVKYSENYADPAAEVWDYGRAGGMMVRAKDYAGPETLYEFLTALVQDGPHGEAFAYKTVSTEVLAWIIKRIEGKDLSAILSERIWSRIGTEEDAYFAIDIAGTEVGGGGLNATLRDLARFGEMMRNGGTAGGHQIVPQAVIDDIRFNGSPEAFAPAGYVTLPGWSYRNMWWISNNAHGAYMARGIYGQNVYIDPKAEMVIARLGSHSIAANTATDPLVLPAYQAAAEALMAGRA
jgi:CubicO group peptidase (beta-lactamase class C family)